MGWWNVNRRHPEQRYYGHVDQITARDSEEALRILTDRVVTWSRPPVADEIIVLQSESGVVHLARISAVNVTLERI